MTDLFPTTALGAQSPEITRIGALTITETPGLALASVALRRGAEVPSILLGTPLPGPGGWAGGNGMTAIWTGPGQWLVAAPDRAETDFAGALAERLGTAVSVTEQTDGWVAFQVAGPNLPALLERLCNIDLAGFGPGRATRTLIEHLGCLVVREGAEAAIILGARSSAGSLHHTLCAAARRIL